MKNGMLSTVIFLLSFSILAHFPASGQVFVKHDATGANNGSSWADAYTDLKTAISNASAGAEIWVAAGTYKPAAPGGSQTATFLINQDLKLLGGFAGAETSADQRDPAVHVTILSGDLNGDDEPGNFDLNKSDNVQHVVSITQAVGNATVIDGFTIQGGYADGAFPNAEGGGVTCTGAPTIRQCLITDNSSYAVGGGIWFREGSSEMTYVENCRFIGNQGGLGGGMDVRFRNITVTGCVFENNTTWDSPLPFERHGGGMFTQNSNCVVKNCSFLSNIVTESGGGLYYWIDGDGENLSLEVDSCTFSQNRSDGGSGLQVWLRGSNSEFTMTNTHFSNNQTTTYYATAAVYTNNAGNGTVTIDHCTFENNHSVYTGGLDASSLGTGDDFDFHITNCIFRNNEAEVFGGGIDLYAVEGSTPNFTIENCLIEGNSAGERAAGVWVDVASSEFQATMKNCRILGNDSPYGSGIDVFQYDIGVPPYPFPANATLRLENCLIAENTNDAGVIAIDSFPDVRFLNCTVAGNAGGGLQLSDMSGITLQNTILYNPGYTEYQALTNDVSVTSNGGNLIGDNSLDAQLIASDKPNTDPLFVGAGDYHVQAGSPCVDLGVDAGNLPALDLDGNARVQGTGVDIGVYESPFTISTHEVIAGTVAISPNPAVDFLNLQLPENDAREFQVVVFDAQGKLVQARTLSGALKLDVQALTPGVYSLKVSAEERVYAGRFVKR